MLAAFTAAQLVVFGLAGAWLFLTARLSGQGESEEAVVIFFVGMSPMAVAYLLGSAIAFARAVALRGAPGLLLIAGCGLLSGVLGVLGLFVLSQASLVRSDRGALGLISGIVVSGLSGLVINSGFLALLLRWAVRSPGAPSSPR
jgi:hypothetical protein